MDSNRFSESEGSPVTSRFSTIPTHFERAKAGKMGFAIHGTADQAGSLSEAGLFVRFITPEPLAFIT